MVLRLDVAPLRQGGCEHAGGSSGCDHAVGCSQVHDELTHRNLSYIQRVLCTEFHDNPDTRTFASMIATPNQLDCEMRSQTAGFWREPKRERSGSPL